MARIAARRLRNSGSATRPVHSLRRLGREVAIEEPVGGSAQAALLKIHQQEGEVVEDVSAGDLIGEFHRVEQRRLAVDEDDVAQVQIAMATADESGLAALEQDRPHDCERQSCVDCKLPGGRGVEKIGPLGESGAVLLDIGLERMGRARCVPERRAGVGTADRDRQLVDDLVGQAASRRDAVERRILVEAAHVGDPLDDFALAADRIRVPAIA